MRFERVEKPIATWPAIVMLLFVLAAGVAVVYRFTYGLGATTGQSDTWAWGIWKAFNVMGLISIGAAGFASAALIYFLGGERYHGIARATVLWAILCYGMCGASLVADIAIPWRIINPIYMWPMQSVLFEVAWCVMLYLTVLAAELAPAAFDHFGWDKMRDMWRKVTPIYTVIGLSFFTYLMSHHSLAWTAAAAVLYSALAVLLPRARRNPSTPALLVMFGVVLSVNHQSSLGSLFLLMPDKLSHFWWSPRLPFNFLLSAVGIGFCLVLVERTLVSWAWKRKMDDEMLSKLALIAAAALWLYLGFRIVDVLVEAVSVAAAGNIATAFGNSTHATLFVSEMFAGVFCPALMLSFGLVRRNPSLRFAAAVLVVLGGLFNRLNVGVLGMVMAGSYVPTVVEIAVSVGTVAAIILIYSVVAKLLPVMEAEAPAAKDADLEDSSSSATGDADAVMA